MQPSIASLAGFNGPNGDAENHLVKEDPAATIRRHIAERERQLGEQQAALLEAKDKREAAEAARRDVLVAARVDGDPGAQAKLAEATAAMEVAQRDEKDLATTIAQLEAMAGALRRDLKAAERRKIEEQICALAVKRLQRAPEIDGHIEKAVKLIDETLRDAVEMHNLATTIGVTGHYFDAANPLAGFLHISLSRVLPRDFSCRSDLAAHYGKPLAVIERDLLGGHLEGAGIALPKEEQTEATPAA